MDSSEKSGLIFLFGFCLGVILASTFSYLYTQDKRNKCEASLPRSQTCVLIAVPKQ